ncbi:aminotransferase class IV [Candidatus Pelagibacter sp.]|nr:aminotransferase class IV [Candidatus Pelagibacter sp.]
MATYLLKKSYQHKDFKEVNFKDLWNSNGVFTTMWIFGSPPKILFFKEHIKNLIESIKAYKLDKKNLKKNIFNSIKINIKKNKKYNHLLRVAVNKKLISVSLRKRIKPKINFNLKLVNLKRVKPEYKNLMYKKIINHLSKFNNSTNDIALCVNNKILESGTSNILFVSKNKIYSPINKFYKGITFKFFEKKIGKIIKKNIFINSLCNYDEIILIGSGKGVASVKTIDNSLWYRKSFKFFKKFSKIYTIAKMKSLKYK